MTDQLTLKSLHLYSPNDGKTYDCRVQFTAYGNEVHLKLGPKLASQITEMCMSDIVSAIQVTAAEAVFAIGAARAKQIEPPPVTSDSDEEIPF